jgi:Glycosyl hydrolase-like 10
MSGFGVSPFGVWRNADKDPINGSETRAGLTCYDDLYADVLLWLKNGWIDYVAPQIYWSIGYPPADYARLVEWWSKHTYGKHLYIGHAAYKIANSPNDANWNRPDEISKQIALNRSNPNVQGSIFFSTKPILRNPLGLKDSLIGRIYTRPALMPGMSFLAKSTPIVPQFCRIKGTPTSVKLAWHNCTVASGEEMPYYFAIYRFEGEYIGDFKDPRNLLQITPFYSENWIYEDQTAYEGAYYTYVVTAFSRANLESYSSEPYFIKKTKRGVKKKRKVFGYW